jgi:transporter family protein
LSLAPWLIWALLSAVFAALTAIFAKVGLQDIDSDLATLIRVLIISMILGLLVCFSGKWVNPLSLSVKTLGFLALSAFATGASWICYFRALQTGQAFQVAPVDKLSVVLVAVFAFIFLSERPELHEWIGICLITLGVIVLTLPF